jgi:hypothetical protein
MSSIENGFKGLYVIEKRLPEYIATIFLSKPLILKSERIYRHWKLKHYSFKRQQKSSDLEGNAIIEVHSFWWDRPSTPTATTGAISKQSFSMVQN